MTIPFDFNFYSSLLLPAFIHGLVFSALSVIRFWKERQLHDLLLGMILLLFITRLSFWMLGFAGWYDSHDAFTTFMFYFPFNTLIFIGPCLYCYFLSLTNRDFKFSRLFWPHLVLPAALLTLYIVKFVIDFSVYYPFPTTTAYQFGTHGPLAQLDKSDAVYAISYTSILFYLWLILRQFNSYRAYLLQHFSDQKNIDLSWLKWLLVFAATSIGVMFIFYVAGNFFPNLSYRFNWYPYFILGIMIYYTSINGYFNSHTLYKNLHFSIIDDKQNTNDESTSIALPNLNEWKAKLEYLMENEELFTDPDLTLIIVANKLSTHPQIASKIINDGFKLNFNEFVNQLRIEKVIEQFKNNDHQKYSIMGIAYNCGFNSKTTFNRAFKKATGKTPSGYIEEL